METFTELFEMGPGSVIPTSYDTAWIARLEEIDPNMSNEALEWLCGNQLPDGSWGAAEPFYYHDRVISTLAAMIALTYRGKRSHDRLRIEKGLHALERITSGATQGLIADPNGATAGFEMIVPTLVAEAEKIGIIKQQGDHILGRLVKQRAAKLAVLHRRKVNREMPLAFSSEMAGHDGQHMLDIANLLEKDGSVSHSPSATAYYLLQIEPDNAASLNYLRNSISDQGSIGYAVPFEICERAWVLWNVGLLEHIDDNTIKLCKPHLEYLRGAWNDKGLGFAAEHTVVDGDDTSVVFDVLTRFGYELKLDALLSFEENTHFRCYTMEITNSISTNIHFLSAFRRYGISAKHPVIQKISKFLCDSAMSNAYWFDKWNASPFYATAHAIISLIGIDDELVQNSVDWILANQRPSGDWGYYGSSAEETAYCIQALCIWKKSGGRVPKDVFFKGAQWLKQHSEPPYPFLWIAKTLNYSDWIVRAEILCALKLMDEVL